MVEDFNYYKSQCSYIAGRIRSLSESERKIFNSLGGEEKLMMLGLNGNYGEKKALKMYLANPAIW